MKSIYEYKNYRQYVADFYAFSKSLNKGFSHRVFARMAGFKSSNFIKFVIDNKSNISEKSAEKLALAMKLKKNEVLFFKSLVRFNQAKTAEERHQFAQELLRSQINQKVFPLREALFNYTSKWYLSLLRGLVGLPNFKEDLKWLAKNIHPPLSQSEIRTGFEDLIKIGLLVRDANGQLKQTAADIASDDEVAVSAVAQFHREMMQRASESIDRIPREKRDISGVTMGMSLETALKVKALVQSFRKEIVELVSQDEKANAIYQLNIQFFPLIETDENKGGDQ